MGLPAAVRLRTQSDERLVALAREGHERAFETIVRRYRRPLLSACQRICGDGRGEDVLQQALLSAWAGLRRGDDVRDVRAWLYRIVRNAAVSHRRRGGHDALELVDTLSLAPSPAEEAERRAVVQETLAAIAALPDRQREALLRIAIQGHNQDEVAGELGLSAVAVRQLVHRARTALARAATAPRPRRPPCRNRRATPADADPRPAARGRRTRPAARWGTRARQAASRRRTGGVSSHMTLNRRIVTAGATVLAVTASLGLASGASAKDRNHDRLPDRWEHAHHLSLRVNQARRDQDHDGLNNRGEFRAHLNPRRADTDGDGIRDGDENAGRIASFADGVLTINLAGGGTLAGEVTQDTEIECEDVAHESDHGGGDDGDHHGGGDHGDDDDHNCASDALTAGRAVHEAELEARDGKATFEKVELGS